MNNRWRSLAAHACSLAWRLRARRRSPRSRRPRPRRPWRLHRGWRGRAFRRISSGCCRSSAASGTRLPPARQQTLAHGSERWLGMSPTRSVTRRASASHAGARCRRSSARHCASLAEVPGTAADRAGERCARTSTAFSSCRPSAARCCASSGATPRPRSASRWSSARATGTATRRARAGSPRALRPPPSRPPQPH